jgi:nucleotide-binding universal stress UspA family protein
MQILAATDFSTRSNRALRQAGLLAQPLGAQLALVHIVDDDQPQELVAMEKREAARILAEQVGAVAELRGVQCRPIVAEGDPFDGILRTADAIKADLIVMGAHRRQLLRDIVIGTTIERVIRVGALPVLMVNHEAQRKYEKILAPVDMSEASANALRVALALGLIGRTGATVLHALVALAKGKLFIAGADQASVEEYVAREREAAAAQLDDFLAEHDLVRESWSLRLEEGDPGEVISSMVEKTRPDLLVMGTRGRSGLAKALLGSVTEACLRSLDVDILAVPPIRR